MTAIVSGDVASRRFFISLGLGMGLITLATAIAAMTRWVDGLVPMVGDWSMRIKNPNALFVLAPLTLGIIILGFTVVFYLQWLHDNKSNRGYERQRLTRNMRLLSVIMLGIIIASIITVETLTSTYDLGGPELLPEVEYMIFVPFIGMLILTLIGSLTAWVVLTVTKHAPLD